MNVDALIAAAESQLGQRLPTRLRERLSLQNGGSVHVRGEEWTLYPVFDPANARGTTGNLVEATRLARSFRDFPPDAIAIGENGEGDYLIARGEDVEVWDRRSRRAIPVSIRW